MFLTRVALPFRLASGAVQQKSLRSLYIAVRCSSLNQPSRNTSTEFKPVYKLPFIVTARLICRMKLYQTVIVLGLVGTSVVTQADLIVPLSLCTVSLTMLGIMGEFFRRLIGIIYVNPVTYDVKIAHLTFWGNRKEVFHHMNDIIPPVDNGEDLADTYVKLAFVDKSISPLYLSVKHGHVIDKELFSKVIGGAL